MFQWTLRGSVGLIRGGGGVMCLRRGMGGGPKPRRRLTAANAAEMVSDMSKEERTLLIAMLEKRQAKEQAKFDKKAAKLGSKHQQQPEDLAKTAAASPNGAASAAAVQPPTTSQLWKHAIHQGLPYVGFGFLDNFVMICAGEYIELSIGSSLGIGTMTAAALGNTVSDWCGIGSAWYVEKYCYALIGFDAPPLTLEQLEESSSCKYWGFAGRIGGLTIGCLLGMVPLLFYDDHPNQEQQEEPLEKDSQ